MPASPLERMVKRHNTAMSRVELSRPIRLAVEAGLLAAGGTLLDYGCGRGDDLRTLEATGIRCWGWDPVYRPEGCRDEADVVNLGYVINVIEDVQERGSALADAWGRTRKALVVSARLTFEAKGTRHAEYRDGYLTQKSTFQKFFTQSELRDWISTELAVSPVAAGPGIFFVFRDEELRESYLASRSRRQAAIPHPRQSDLLFDQHKELLVPLMEFFTSRGRLPERDELSVVSAIEQALGSVRRAFGVIQRVTGKDQWLAIQEERAQDLLLYMALERFTGRPRLSALPKDLRRDVKAFFGAYTRACEAADQLLFSAGDMEAVDQACREATCGKLTNEALYIHRTALPLLPHLLRVYEGCSRAYVGDVEDANIIKLDRRKPKISYLSYPEFDRKPHPALESSMIVILPCDIQCRQYHDSENPPILHRKEEFVPPDYPGREKFAKLTKQEERRGLLETPVMIGFRRYWEELLQDRGLQLRGHRLVRCSSNP